MKDQWLRPTEALSRSFFAPALGEEDDAEENPVVRRLGFKIGDIGLLILSETTSELTDMLPICPIPNTADWLRGLINLRGNLVPIFDLASLLKAEHAREKKGMLLILGEGEAAAGIIIDDLPSHQTLANSDKLESLPAIPDIAKPYMSSGYEKEGEIWFNFDHEGFFTSLADRVAA